MADKCPLGEDCDLTLAYMMGAERAKDTIVVLRAEVEDLGNRLHHVHRLWANNEHALRAEVERLKAELEELDFLRHEGGDESVAALEAENERLRAALRYAIENGEGTQYWGDDDDCGTHSCCGNVSYGEHEADCWIVKARAALEEKL